MFAFVLKYRNTNKEGVRLVLYNNLVNQIEKVMSVIKWV